LNNPTEEELIHLRSLIPRYGAQYKYHVFQQERGDHGTLHVQGYIQAANPVEFKTWKRTLGDRAHIEFAKASADANRAYCTKDSDRVPGTLIYEEGQIPSPGKRNDVSAFTDAVQVEGNTLRDVALDFPEFFLKYPNAFAQFRSAVCPQRTEKTKVLWFYGATGLGKSYTIRQLAPDAYWKSCTNHWWNGYDPLGHTDVVLDDYRTNFCDFSQLLRYFDEYPLSVEFKGGVSVFRPRRIFVSCPKSPLQSWNLRCPEDLQQLVRRIEVIVEVCPGHIRRYDKGSEADLARPTDNRVAEPVGGGAHETDSSGEGGESSSEFGTQLSARSRSDLAYGTGPPVPVTMREGDPGAVFVGLGPSSEEDEVDQEGGEPSCVQEFNPFIENRPRRPRLDEYRPFLDDDHSRLIANVPAIDLEIDWTAFDDFF
jgi:hypothetical protein